MSPVYFPPTTDDVPPVLPPDKYGGDLTAYRLFAHYKSRARGRTVILKTDNTCVVVDWPIEETGSNFDITSIGGVPVAQISRVFMGGHTHSVTSAEQSALQACGAGGTFT